MADDGGGDAKKDEYEEDSSKIFISHYETRNQHDETEVDELKHRISQLEHLVVSATLSAPSFMDKSTTRLTPHGLIQRVSQLESLLAASELDNQRLERELQLLNASKQEQEFESFRNIKERDLRIKNVEQDMELLNVKLTKATKKLSSMEEYIHTLPSQQELDDLKQELSKCQVENDLLQDKVDRLEVSLNVTQETLTEKEDLYNKAIQR